MIIGLKIWIILRPPVLPALCDRWKTSTFVTRAQQLTWKAQCYNCWDNCLQDRFIPKHFMEWHADDAQLSVRGL